MAVRRTNYKVLEDGTRYGEYACLSTDDKPVEIRSPIQAREYGISMIAQELN